MGVFLIPGPYFPCRSGRGVCCGIHSSINGHRVAMIPRQEFDGAGMWDMGGVDDYRGLYLVVRME